MGFSVPFIIGGEKKPIIAYGDGSSPSGGRGEVSVPMKYIKKKCK